MAPADAKARSRCPFDRRWYAPTDVVGRVTVACGERSYDDGDPPSLLNPSLLVEVTSDTSEDYDRGAKFVHYQAIASLREYVVVSHREPRIDHYRLLRPDAEALAVWLKRYRGLGSVRAQGAESYVMTREADGCAADDRA